MPRSTIVWGIALGIVSSPALATEASYICADGTKLNAVFSTPKATPGSVVLTFAGAPAAVTLPQALSADGGRYADADIEFWIKGEEASLTRSGQATTCKAR